MKTRPILFSGPMVRAILDGRKTQTRRIVKPQPSIPLTSNDVTHDGRTSAQVAWEQLLEFCPYGVPGDRLWVKETFARVHPAMLQSLDPDPDSLEWTTVYRADANGGYVGKLMECTKWKPSIFMRREYSRITLEIKSVRVERLQEISAPDCQSEGIYIPRCECEVCSTQASICPADASEYVMAYRALWESINGPGSWESNPWVWVITFRNVQP